jgi:type I restriction enzyme S subunit
MAGDRNETRTGGRPASQGVIPGDFALSVGRPDKAAPSGWVWTALSDVARLESGHTPSRKHPEYWGGDVPWIGIKDATENHGRVLEDTFQHTNQLGIANSSARILPSNTVCLSRTASVGYVVVMGRPMATSQDFVNWVCSEAIDHRYLKYVLLSERNAFMRFASGTTHQTIYFPEVKAFHVCLPPLSEQHLIAHVLGTLDDKIELNRRRNETLEAMARALFQDWFVDFGPVRAKRDGHIPPGMDEATAALFSDDFQESSMGPIPRGWIVQELGELAKIDKGLSYKGDRLTCDGGLPMVNLGCFSGSGLFQVEKIKRYVGEYRERHVIEAGELVVANTDMTQNRVIIGSPALVPEIDGESRFIFTHHVFAIRFNFGREKWRHYVYFSLLRPEFREIAEGFSTGTTVLALPRDGLTKYPLCLPPDSLLDAFERQVLPLLKLVLANNQQSRTLAILRDTLLPKLISGELRINDAERFMEERAA